MHKKVAKIVIIDEEEVCEIIKRIREKMIKNKLVTVRTDGEYQFTTDDEER